MDNSLNKTKIKICGLFREVDMDYVNQTNPDYIGFIIGFNKSHRNISNEMVALFKAKLNENIKSVGVFVNPNIDDILQVEKHLDILQLHGQEDNDYISTLREKLPNKEIWKAFKICNKEDLTIAQNSIADRIVLDNGYGTGQSFDWTLLDDFNKKFVLAGGINCENIRDAIDTFTPDIIDISSGVESDKIKDLNKIKHIIKEIRK